MARRKTFSPKDQLIYLWLHQRAPGLIDLDQLAADYYEGLRLKPPPHWRLTMTNTLKRLKARGVPLSKAAGQKGRGYLSEWRLRESLKDATR